MKIFLKSLLLFLSIHGLLYSAPVDLFFPWVGSNSANLGMNYESFRQTRPAATQLSIGGEPSETYNGGMSEQLNDGSLLIYGFIDGKLNSVMWTSRPSDRLISLLGIVRNSLQKTCILSTSGTTGRIDSLGAIAEVAWESYRPKAIEKHLITLIGTSEGIEVMLLNGTVVTDTGSSVVPRPYSKILSGNSSNPSDGAKPSNLIDHLTVIRLSGRNSDSLGNDPAQSDPPEMPIPNPSEVSDPANTKLPAPSSEFSKSADPAMAIWFQIVGLLLIIVFSVVFVYLIARRK